MLRLTDAYLIDMWFGVASLKFITKNPHLRISEGRLRCYSHRRKTFKM